MPHEIVDRLAPLRATPRRAGVACDFDGTLAQIVDDPAAARPMPGMGEALAALAGTYGLVAVVSGRPVSFLAEHLPRGIVLSGLYGLESSTPAGPRDHPDAAPWRAVVDEAVRRAQAECPAGVLVEHKGLSLTLHHRVHPDVAGVARTWAEQQAARSGLEIREAKKSLELHPPVAADKGTALDVLLDGLDAACFVGDDVGDLPAFDALDRFTASGGRAVRIAVVTPETDARLVERADLTLEGPEGVLALLEGLLA